MVEFSGGPGGLIEHGFSNTVFIIPGVIIFALSGKSENMNCYRILILPVSSLLGLGQLQPNSSMLLTEQLVGVFVSEE